MVTTDLVNKADHIKKLAQIDIIDSIYDAPGIDTLEEK